MAVFEVKLERPELVKPKTPTRGKTPEPPANQNQRVAPKAFDIVQPAGAVAKSPQKPAKTPEKVEKIKHRPSVEIAKGFVELDLKAVIDVENEQKLSKKELRALRKQEKKERKRRWRGLKIFLSILFLLAVAAGIAFLWWETSIQPMNSSDTNLRQFEVAKGATTDQVADGLQKAGFIRNTLAFKIYARWTGNTIQAGTHMLSTSYSLPEISDKLTEASTQEVSIQIPPGLTLKELRNTFLRNGFSEEEIDTAYAAEYDNAILAERPAGASLEGYIFPDTYRIYAGDSLETLIAKSLDELEKVVTDNDLKQKFADRGLTLHEGLTLASIVELEVSGAEDQKLVAGVFYNRLTRGMNLGSDITFHYAYANGLCNVNTPSCDSVYNTRIHAGFPPSPVANVNEQALIATANPMDSGYLFFVAGYEYDDSGNKSYRTYFGATDAEHNNNVNTYCHELCQL